MWKVLTKKSNHCILHIKSTHIGFPLNPSTCTEHPVISTCILYPGSAESGPLGKCRHFPVFVNSHVSSPPTETHFHAIKVDKAGTDVIQSFKDNILTNWSFSEAWQSLAHQS